MNVPHIQTLSHITPSAHKGQQKTAGPISRLVFMSKKAFFQAAKLTI
jgi:hypothetical protein